MRRLTVDRSYLLGPTQVRVRTRHEHQLYSPGAVTQIHPVGAGSAVQLNVWAYLRIVYCETGTGRNLAGPVCGVTNVDLACSTEPCRAPPLSHQLRRAGPRRVRQKLAGD